VLDDSGEENNEICLPARPSRVNLSVTVPKTRPARANNTEILTIKAEEFLSQLASGVFLEKSKGRRVIVQGDIDLRKHRLKSQIDNIPDVSITGNLVANGECALRTCLCRVSGDVNLDGSPIEEFISVPDLVSSVSGHFSAKGCTQLRKISGKFLKDVNLDKSSIPVIGSDFCCEGDLSVKGCRKIRLLDCSAYAILADDSSLERFGPNVSADGVSAERCSRFTLLTPITGLRWGKFDGSGVREVDSRFKCAGPVYYKRCRHLTKLSGSSMTVEVSMAPLQSVTGLQSDEIIFTDCAVLPESMAGMRAKVLVFARCTMRALPAGLSPKASLRIGGCPHFSQLPNRWSGDLSISQLPSLESTPSEFRCEGNFDIAECPNLRTIAGFVGGNLQIMCGTPSLHHLGENLQVAGDLKVAGDSGAKSLNCKIGGGLSAKASHISETGAKLRVGEWGDFSGCRKLGPIRGVFGGNVELSGSSVTHLGADFECAGNLILDNADQIVSLNCTVGKTIVADNSSLQRTGPAFRCGGELWIRHVRNLKSMAGEVRGTIKIEECIKKKLLKVQKYQISERTSKEAVPLSKPRAGTAIPRPAPRVYPTESFAPGWRGL
jgi:hypothetical protein